MNKTFFASDNLLVFIDTVDTRTLGDPIQEFRRNCVKVMAHTGVNAEDILNEVQDIERNIECGRLTLAMANDNILTTTLTEKDDWVVALTYKGFVKIAYEYEGSNHKLARYSSLAQELIYWRDHK